jgi:hypothetical protein
VVDEVGVELEEFEVKVVIEVVEADAELELEVDLQVRDVMVVLDLYEEDEFVTP